MTSANQNRQKKTRGFRLVSKILKAPAESGETGSTPNPVNGRLLQLDTMAELAKD